MEPSSTNYPNASFFLLNRNKYATRIEIKHLILAWLCFELFLPNVMKRTKEIGVYRKLVYTKELGGYSDGVPPLPIPNREVKPFSADGTAKVGE